MTTYYGNCGNISLTVESPCHTLSSIIQDAVRKSSGVQAVLNEFEQFVIRFQERNITLPPSQIEHHWEMTQGAQNMTLLLQVFSHSI